MKTPLTPDLIRESLKVLPEWQYANDSLTKRFQFKDFRQAMGFLVRLSFEAEARNHHPEIYNVYNTVELTLRTHDAGNQVTEQDIDLAHAIEACLQA